MPGRWPGGVSLLSRTLANAGRRQAGQQHLPGARPGGWPQDPRSPLAALPAPESLLHRVLRDPWPSDPGSPAVRSGRADAARATTRHPVLRASAPAVLHGSAAGAAAPALTASGPAARPRTSPVLCRDPRSSRLAFRRCPGAGVAGVGGEVADRVAELAVDRPPETDRDVFVELPGDRGRPRPGRPAIRGQGNVPGSPRSRRAAWRRARSRRGARR